MTKLLFVDDDVELLKMCKVWFEPRFLVETSSNVGDACAQLKADQYDLIVVDLGLPDGDGRQIVDQFRTRGGATPILVLTGRQDVDSKVLLLNTGADDYLTKPFHFKELEARVNSMLRRAPEIKPSVLTAGKISLNLSNAHVTKGSEAVTLTPKEFALLEFFMRHPNQAFTQDMLMQRVWTNDSDASPDIVRVYINRLRKKIEDEGAPALIHNQRGHGYIFKAE